MYVCTHVCGECLHVCNVGVEARGCLPKSQSLSTLFFSVWVFICLFLFCLEMGLSLNLEFISWLDWLANKLPVSSWDYLPRTGLISRHSASPCFSLALCLGSELKKWLLSKHAYSLSHCPDHALPPVCLDLISLSSFGAEWLQDCVGQKLPFINGAQTFIEYFHIKSEKS